MRYIIYVSVQCSLVNNHKGGLARSLVRSEEMMVAKSGGGEGRGQHFS